ncbi:growth hormone secretagogue receptor type 1-like [Mytilus californianus]|uniref:growth hormone secretagogue receptor type 1-like n=1 Tax=Mytilus californianus TaxID=6549 RepID=UPI0022456FE3|nr:growth hormone secretagogue receptor type 1-like [Mytilus californianus]
MFISNESLSNIYLEELNNAKVKSLIPNTVLIFAFLLASLVGNGLVLFVYKFKLKSKTDDRYFIPCLALVDMIACSIGATHSISMNFNPFNFRNDLICKLIWTLHQSISLSSALLLLAIAVQRYIKVSRLLNSSMSLRSKRLTIISILIGSIVISVPCLVLYGEDEVVLKYENRTITGYNCGAVPNVNRYFLFGYSVTLLLMCLSGIFALIILYCLILRIIYRQESFRRRNTYRPNKHSLNVRAQHSSGNTIQTDISNYNQQENTNGGSDIKGHISSAIQTGHQSKFVRIICLITRKHRFSIMFFLITILSCISYLPRIALMIIESAIASFWDNLTDTEYVIALCVYRGHLLNTVVNPVIYLVFDTVFRSSCQQLCCRN